MVMVIVQSNRVQCSWFMVMVMVTLYSFTITITNTLLTLETIIGIRVANRLNVLLKDA
jgi:hypothetical protein